ncbi:MAG: pseudaminic acid cytidylyltransferase [Reinekea sp.]|nr:pseudaminic acid cytidylyltransferase [Reinekea sp.]
MTVCIIPARGGSKRIPRKNIKPFHGKALIGYSIENALASGLFNRVVVSTDDAEIAQVAIDFGAEVPFIRPAELADDHANTFDLLQHAARWIQKNDVSSEVMCCLYATAPFVEVADLQQGYDLLSQHQEADYVYSITEFPFPIQRSVRQNNGFVTPCFPENMLKRSQDLEPIFHDAGQFYWGRVEAFAQKTNFFGDRSMAVVLPRYRVVDIDTPEDWEVAEIQFQVLQASGKLS